MLKIWVDAHGISTTGAQWEPGHEAYPFDAVTWLRERPSSVFDVQDIGLLASPPPDLGDLAQRLQRGYAFLADMDASERRVATIEGRDRTAVIGMLGELTDGRLASIPLW